MPKYIFKVVLNYTPSKHLPSLQANSHYKIALYTFVCHSDLEITSIYIYLTLKIVSEVLVKYTILTSCIYLGLLLI
jgi:hypothetical protein